VDEGDKEAVGVCVAVGEGEANGDTVRLGLPEGDRDAVGEPEAELDTDGADDLEDEGEVEVEGTPDGELVVEGTGVTLTDVDGDGELVAEGEGGGVAEAETSATRGLVLKFSVAAMLKERATASNSRTPTTPDGTLDDIEFVTAHRSEPSVTSSARCVKPHVPVGPCKARYIPSRAYTGAPWLMSLAGCHP
jgi:hypothetical protein